MFACAPRERRPTRSRSEECRAAGVRSAPRRLARWAAARWGAPIRGFDWPRPHWLVEHWPQSLRSAVSICLPSKAQIKLCWGPDLIALYNDGYWLVFGAKHPHVLGLPVREAWREVWPAARSRCSRA